MTIIRTVGSTSNSVTVYLVDATTGEPKTGVAAGDVTVSVIRVRSFTEVVTLTALPFVAAPWQSGGWYEYTQPGLYRLDLSNSVFMAGVHEAVVYISGSGIRMEPLVISLEFDHQAATDDLIDEITNLGANLPSEAYITAAHATTVDQIRGAEDKTISDAHAEAKLARQCVGNSRIISGSGVEVIADDDGSTPLRQITRSSPSAGVLVEEVTAL